MPLDKCIRSKFKEKKFKESQLVVSEGIMDRLLLVQKLSGIISTQIFYSTGVNELLIPRCILRITPPVLPMMRPWQAVDS